jgi:hypothetical protein
VFITSFCNSFFKFFTYFKVIYHLLMNVIKVLLNVNVIFGTCGISFFKKLSIHIRAWQQELGMLKAHSTKFIKVKSK